MAHRCYTTAIVYPHVPVVRCSHWSLFSYEWNCLGVVNIQGFDCISFRKRWHHFNHSRLHDWRLWLLNYVSLCCWSASDSLKIIVCLLECLRVVALMLLQSHHVIVRSYRRSRDSGSLFRSRHNFLFTVICLLRDIIHHFLLVLLLSVWTAVLFCNSFWGLWILFISQLQIFR